MRFLSLFCSALLFSILLSSCSWIKNTWSSLWGPSSQQSQNGSAKQKNQRPVVVFEKRPGAIDFQYNQTLDENIIAEFKNYKITKEEAQPPTVKAAFLNLQNVFVAMIIEKVIADDKSSSIESVTFNFKKPGMTVAQILNQQGIKASFAFRVEFNQDTSSDLFDSKTWQARFADQTLTLKDLDESRLSLSEAQTRVFAKQVDSIIAELVRKDLNARAEAQDMRVYDYISQNIYPPEQKIELDNPIMRLMLIEKERELTRENADLLQMSVTPKVQQQVFIQDIFGQSNQPLKLALSPPQFQIDLREDWMAGTSNIESPAKVIYIGGLRNHVHRKALAVLNELRKIYPKVYFGYRPYYPTNDRYEAMMAEAALCAWSHNRDQFWDFLFNLSRIDRKKTGEQIEALVGGLAKAKETKQCLFKSEVKPAIKYHQDYGKFLNIVSQPVIAIGGEVYTGINEFEPLMQAIDRVVQPLAK